MSLRDELVKMGACVEAVEWVGDRDLATAWAECMRAAWMIWYAAKKCKRNSPLHKIVVRTVCTYTRPMLKHVPDDEDRARVAIETAEAWTRDEATIKQVEAAAIAAYAAASAITYTTTTCSVIYAAYVAAYAATRTTAYVVTAVAHAIRAVYAIIDPADRNTALKTMADIVRGIITVDMLEGK